MINKLNKKAVALEYGINPVPTLSARGDGDMAKAIIDEAKRLGVHIAEDPQLVSLLSELEGSPIQVVRAPGLNPRLLSARRWDPSI